MKQEVFSGDNSFRKIVHLLSEKQIGSVFVVTGRHFESDTTHPDIKSFLGAFRCTMFIKQGINVTFDEIDLAYSGYRSNHPDCIVAIGGGSVMDLAKGVIYRHIQREKAAKPLFIAIPTTGGSGSEATCIAVVYDNKKKQSLENNMFMPDIAILDPQLSLSLPAVQTAISGIDAFAQAIESFWSIHATHQSRSFAREAITILMEYLPRAVQAPTLLIREKVLWASHLAGKAINITRTTGPHALSYFLTANYNIPHGQAVALFLPIFFLYNSQVSEDNSNHPEGPMATRQAMKELFSILQVQNSKEAMEFTRRFILGLDLAVDFMSLSIDKLPILDDLLNEVNQQRFKNNPVIFDKGAIAQLCREYL